jgi:uncharacterized protein (DUF2141 family)
MYDELHELLNQTRPGCIERILDRVNKAAPLLLLTACLFGCASPRPPQGGPVDTEPPEITETYPQTGATRFSEREVRFRFSEYVDHQSVQQAVHISPYFAKPLLFSWSGKVLTVRFPEDLQPDRTYVVSVGASVKDIHAGNVMRSSYSLAFSSGDSLDKGQFRGIVFDEKPTSVSLFAYVLDNRNRDTINPSMLQPDYVSQAGSDGSFRFTNVREAEYRVFAVRDKQANYTYDAETDEIGISTIDIHAAQNDSLSEPLRFRLHREDTTAPYIQSIEAVNEHFLQIRLSEGIAPEVPALSHFRIVDSSTSARLSIQSVQPSAKKNSFVLFLSDPMKEIRYLLFADSLCDQEGNCIVQSRSAFIGSGIHDSTRPSIVEQYPMTGATGVPVDSLFQLSFSHPMLFQNAGVTLQDSTKKTYSTAVVWPSKFTMGISHEPLPEGMPCTLCIDFLRIKDSLRSKAVADTALCVRFTTDAESNYGSMRGTVIDKKKSPARKIVEAEFIERKIPRVSITATPDGAFLFSKLLPGKYTLSAFSDENNDGKFSPGKAHPFKPAERFGFAQDTVRVRARWETAGRTVTIP